MRATIAMNLILAGALFGQFEIKPNLPACQPQSGPKPEFEVASVRASPPQSAAAGQLTIMGLRGGPGSTDPERMSGKIEMRNALLRAFGVLPDQLSGPDWLTMERYDFSAIVPEGATQDQFDLMLQNLLIDRFKISMHCAKKDFTVYDIVVAKSGVKMKPSTAQQPAPAQPQGPRPADPNAIRAQTEQALAQLQANVARGPNLDSEGYTILPDDNKATMRSRGLNGQMWINARGQSMASLLRSLQNGIGSGVRVVDKTGLTGFYDFKLHFVRPNTPPPPQGGPDSDDPAPDIASAMQSQLGLRLEKSTMPLDVLIIDHIEKTPVEN